MDDGQKDSQRGQTDVLGTFASLCDWSTAADKRPMLSTARLQRRHQSQPDSEAPGGAAGNVEPVDQAEIVLAEAALKSRRASVMARVHSLPRWAFVLVSIACMSLELMCMLSARCLGSIHLGKPWGPVSLTVGVNTCC